MSCARKAVRRRLSPVHSVSGRWDVAHLIREFAAEQQASAPRANAGRVLGESRLELQAGLCRGPDWPDVEQLNDGGAGLTSVPTARHDRRYRVSVGGYLVDTGCPGIKNALGPKATSERVDCRNSPAATSIRTTPTAIDPTGAGAAAGLWRRGVRPRSRVRAASRRRRRQGPTWASGRVRA